MAVVFHNPENSFIQFRSVLASPLDTEVCGQSFETCLPISAGDDYAFQLYVNGTVSEDLQDNFIIRLVSQDDTVESADIAAVWFYDADNDVTWANVTTDFNINPFKVVKCMNFKIIQLTQSYQYFAIIETWGNSMTVDIVIDGVTTPAGGGVLTGTSDLVTLLNAFLGSAATVTVISTTAIQIQSDEGNVYGDIIITDSVPHTYSPNIPDPEESTKYISNCLMYVESQCFTRVVAYKGNENIFGFNYALDPKFYNSVRLPVWIEKPQPIIDENYFLLSDGTKKVLSARYEKEYDGHTEYFDEAMHFKFLAALKHDTFLLDGDEYSAEGKYDIGWISLPGSPILNAPATFKVRPTPFFQQNSNCVTV